MKINHRNLTIAKYAGKQDTGKGTVLRGLRIAPEGTFATDGYLAVNVSALESSAFEPLLLDAATVKATAAVMGKEPFDHVAIPAPVISSVVKQGSPASIENDDEPKAIVLLRASLLLRIALAAVEFADGADIALEVEIPHDLQSPVIFRGKDGLQQWTGYLAQARGTSVDEGLNLNKSLTDTQEIIASATKLAGE
jgi:hypothetical protein